MCKSRFIEMAAKTFFETIGEAKRYFEEHKGETVRADGSEIEAVVYEMFPEEIEEQVEEEKRRWRRDEVPKMVAEERISVAKTKTEMFLRECGMDPEESEEGAGKYEEPLVRMLNVNDRERMRMPAGEEEELVLPQILEQAKVKDKYALARKELKRLVGEKRRLRLPAGKLKQKRGLTLREQWDVEARKLRMAMKGEGMEATKEKWQEYVRVLRGEEEPEEYEVDVVYEYEAPEWTVHEAVEAFLETRAVRTEEVEAWLWGHYRANGLENGWQYRAPVQRRRELYRY